MYFRIALILVLFGSSCLGDTIPDEIGTCAAIDADDQRLICFDAIARELQEDSSAVSDQVVSDIGKWRVERNKNPIDDTETVIAALIADSGSSGFGAPVTMFVRCQSGLTEVYVAWNDYLATDGDYDSGYKNVVVRVGTESATTIKWGTSTDQKATFAPDATGLLRRMVAYNSFVAQLTPYNASPVTAVFDTAGMREAIAPINEVCGWKLDTN